MNSQEPHQQLLRADELAQLLRCGKSTVYSLAKKGRIPSIAIGDYGVRFDRTAVLSALAQPRSPRPPRKRSKDAEALKKSA
jgi:excisionase family DNA binding protein